MHLLFLYLGKQNLQPEDQIRDITSFKSQSSLSHTRLIYFTELGNTKLKLVLGHILI